MHSMSTCHLRNYGRVLRMICLDRQWYQLEGPIIPGRQHCETNTHRVQFIQGGEWVVVSSANSLPNRINVVIAVLSFFSSGKLYWCHHLVRPLALDIIDLRVRSHHQQYDTR